MILIGGGEPRVSRFVLCVLARERARAHYCDFGNISHTCGALPTLASAQLTEAWIWILNSRLPWS